MRGSRSTASGRPRGLAPRDIAAIERHLSRREARREQLYERARALRRRAQHRMIELQTATGPVRPDPELADALRGLAGYLRSPAAVEAALARDALQEGTEALLLEAIVRGDPIPGPARLGVDPEEYLLGLGDVIGEIRRLALTALAKGDWDRADAQLALMERLYLDLMRFDTTRAIVQLKPKQDTARALLERTRGDVVLARVFGRATPPAGRGR
jgi:translin